MDTARIEGLIGKLEGLDARGMYLDEVERAVKKARQRANNTEIVELKMGRQLTGYILTGE